jgi:PAS domain S-box-containing protein
MAEEEERIGQLLATARAELAIRTRQTQAMVDSVPVVLGYADADQRIRYANRAFQQIAVVSRDVHGELLREVLGPQAYAIAKPAIERALSGERVTFQGEIAGPAGMRYREVTYVPDVLGGKVVGFVGAGYDVTERVQAEKAARSREAHLQRVLETMSEGLVIQSAEGKIIQANAAATRILGLSLDQLLGRTSMDPQWHAIREDGSPCPGPEHPAIRTLRTGQSIRNEILGVSSAGRPIRWLSVNSEPLYEIDGRTLSGVLATFVDVTETRQAFDRIRSLLQRLELAQEHERRSMAMTLHEGVAQDLYAMSLILRLLEDRVRDDPEVRSYCDSLTQALASSMTDLRQVVMNLQPVGLATLPLAESLRRHAAFFSELTKLVITVHAPDTLRDLGAQPSLLLFRAAQEALTNVSRHAKATKADITLRQVRDQLEMRVVDDGVGIDARSLDKPGSLGLLGLRERCLATGGCMTIQRGPDGGTELTISVPIDAPSGAR